MGRWILGFDTDHWVAQRDSDRIKSGDVQVDDARYWIASYDSLSKEQFVPDLHFLDGMALKVAASYEIWVT